MTIHCYAHMRNEIDLLPFWIRHYGTFCSEIHLFDDGSDDGSVEYARAQPKVAVHPIAMNGLDEDGLLVLAHAAYPTSPGRADYIIWPDLDEFLVHEDIVSCLYHFRLKGYDVVRTLGFNMMGAPLPKDDGRSQLIDLYRTGVRAPVYSKPIIINPRRNIRWSRGKHTIQDETGIRMSPLYREYEPEYWRVRLLHYRFLTPEYTRERNARQMTRVVDKNMGWTNRPEHTGEHSPAWVERTRHLARDVVEPNACYLPPPNDA